MTIKSRTSQATLCLSPFHVFLRFSGMERRQFQRKLCLAKKRFPHMLWNNHHKMWQLPICELKSIYEFCRRSFGVGNVAIQCQQYRDKPRPVQLSLFDLEEN